MKHILLLYCICEVRMPFDFVRGIHESRQWLKRSVDEHLMMVNWLK